MGKQFVAAFGFALLGLAGAPALMAQDLQLPNPPAADQAAAEANAPVEAAPTASASPSTSNPAPGVAVPARGTSMSQVEARHGAPSERAAPVGQPPITRWVYPAFTVYFEYDHVVHAVVTARQ